MLRENDTISKVLLSIEQYSGRVELLRDGVLNNDYTPAKKHFSRLLLWKACIVTETLNFHQWDNKLQSSRVVYHKLRHDMKVPWYALEKDNEFYCSSEHREKQANRHHLSRTRAHADPLGAIETYSEYQTDHDLLESIILDVRRLFPGDPHFSADTQLAMERKRQLIRILYIWSRCNPSVGYKQGIHEILGLIYINLSRESLDIPKTNTFSKDDRAILSLYDSRYLEHDLFTIFNRFVVSSGIINHFYTSEELLMKAINTFNMYLMKVDQLVHYVLITKLRLESQLWIIRYFRLLLLRELGPDLETPSMLWDKLAVIDNHAGLSPIPGVIMFLIVTLLVHIQDDILICDFSEALSLLLHYPFAEKLRGDPEFVNTVFLEAYKMALYKNNDMKLYEFGCKLNKKYNRNIRATPRVSNEVTRSRSSTPTLSPSHSATKNPKAENMAFEKTRLEMRLKKKVQTMLSEHN